MPSCNVNLSITIFEKELMRGNSEIHFLMMCCDIHLELIVVSDKIIFFRAKILIMIHMFCKSFKEYFEVKLEFWKKIKKYDIWT